MADTAAAGRDAFAAAHIGRIAEVLVETREESGAALGYTRDYLPVRVLAVGDALPAPGSIVRVRLTGADEGTCTGMPGP